MKHNGFFVLCFIICYVKNIFIVLCYVLLCENRNFSCYVMLCVMISIFALEHGIFTVNIWKFASKLIKNLLLGKVVKYTVLEKNSRRKIYGL